MREVMQRTISGKSKYDLHEAALDNVRIDKYPYRIEDAETKEVLWVSGQWLPAANYIPITTET